MERQRLRRQRQQILEHRLLNARLIRLLRPTKAFQKSRGVEDVAARALGPVGLDQPYDVRIVEGAEPGRDRIDQMHAAPCSIQRKRLASIRVTNRPRAVAPHRRAVRTLGEAFENRVHSGAGAQMPLAPRIGRLGQTLVRPQELEDRTHLR